MVRKKKSKNQQKQATGAREEGNAVTNSATKAKNEEVSEADAAGGAILTGSKRSPAAAAADIDSTNKKDEPRLTRQKRQKVQNQTKNKLATTKDNDTSMETLGDEFRELLQRDPVSDTEWRHFGRFLVASGDSITRQVAVDRIRQYLTAKAGDVGLSKLDLLQLWKGLWVPLYKVDRSVQEHIAQLMHGLAGPLEEDLMAGQIYLDMEMEEQMALEDSQLEMEDGDSDDNIQDTEEEQDTTMDEEDAGTQDDQNNKKHIRSAALVQLMVRAFFQTVVAEWDNLDESQINKFYTLIRCVLREVYWYLATRQWNIGIIKLLNDAIAEEALMKQPNGVRLHLMDIALEELAKVGQQQQQQIVEVKPITEVIFLEVMEPFFSMAAHGFGDKTVQGRAVEKVLKKFLMEHSLVSHQDDDNKSTELIILNQVHVGTVSSFIFEMASDESTPQANRKCLYDIYKTYERQRKKMGSDMELTFDAVKPGLTEPVGDGDDGEEDPGFSEEQLVEEDDDDLQKLGFVEEESDDANEEPQQSANTTTEKPSQAANKKKRKKKRKKKDKSANKEDGDEGQSQDPPASKQEDEKVSAKKRKKKSKKRGKHEEASDQAKATKMTEQEAETNNSDSGEDAGGGKKRKKMKRRVSFDQHNQARSWKASMHGLRKLDPSEAISKSPERSILLNKGAKSPVTRPGRKGRNSRKKPSYL
ncbi:RNA processing protein 1 homolog B [Seminavis robusta]|uniref:RNA processing protein 1 homolog B n=1 Tax=Seminavis robusta TaxID=568900 RepID=A0A9N8HR26_9STRA|nr:RNA processing protein 1 homolog B [Seminavis robusta]|eukprot:Sro1267_g257720.1 RNA processing protein 1 homolog B (699) ;mRNA; f:28516-30612